MAKQTISLKIKAFLNTVAECVKTYDEAYNIVGIKDKETQDLALSKSGNE